ncbi:hypothetical protein PtA15_12A542 [Puccinia triticina]|uniref:RING-type domain-containing protein n=1 Tax=Puccinia triticina TaxID=208348 RepID=A0ABY7D6K4_9BASI|nr:uncharacterized protein PtA15_12A542 [Puccinia triticina]WAQ90552.1 hypothetical protein PtA15_12A542 [Puccinia triticina]WAR61865.1 hypothetical protein PtB15_12B557 [Puccinia triticina]
MSRPPVASRNPFVPPPNTVTFSAASWSSQGLTFNVLFSITNRSRQFAMDQDIQSSSPDGMWPNSDQPWTSVPSSNTITSPNNSEAPQAHYNIDQTLNSVGQALSAFSLSLQRTITACAMCLEEYQSSDQVLVLPCHPSHFFHRDCLRDWFKEYLNCPLCRKKFGPQ